MTQKPLFKHRIINPKASTESCLVKMLKLIERIPIDIEQRTFLCFVYSLFLLRDENTFESIFSALATDMCVFR